MPKANLLSRRNFGPDRRTLGGAASRRRNLRVCHAIPERVLGLRRSVQRDFAEPEPGRVGSKFAEPEPEPQLNRGSVRLGFGLKLFFLKVDQD